MSETQQQSNQVPTSGDDIIIIDDVSFAYGDRPVHQGLNIAVKRGSITAIMGPSGCLLYTSPSPRDRG